MLAPFVPSGVRALQCCSSRGLFMTQVCFPSPPAHFRRCLHQGIGDTGTGCRVGLVTAWLGNKRVRCGTPRVIVSPAFRIIGEPWGSSSEFERRPPVQEEVAQVLENECKQGKLSSTSSQFQ